MSSPAVLEGGKKHHKQHKKHESKRGRTGLNKAESERLSAAKGSELMRDAESAFDDASRAKSEAAKGQWASAEMDERNAADSEAQVEREAKKKYVKKAAAVAEEKELMAAKKIRKAIKGGETDALAGGEVAAPIAGGEVAPIAGGDAAPAVLAGGDAAPAVLAGGDAAPATLEGGDLELEGGKKGGSVKKSMAKYAASEAKTAAKKAEFAAIREVAGVHVGHGAKERERRMKSRSRSPKKHHSKSPKKHHSKSPKKHHSKSPKKEHREGSPKRPLPHAFKLWSKAREDYFGDKKQMGVLQKGSREYEAVRKIYDKMSR
jgi:hypothetical protein